MPQHVRTYHSGYSADGIEDGMPLPPAMVQNMKITREEEIRMKIPEDRVAKDVANPTVSLIPVPLKSILDQRSRKRSRLASESVSAQKQRRLDISAGIV